MMILESHKAQKYCLNALCGVPVEEEWQYCAWCGQTLWSPSMAAISENGGLISQETVEAVLRKVKSMGFSR